MYCKGSWISTCKVGRKESLDLVPTWGDVLKMRRARVIPIRRLSGKMSVSIMPGCLFFHIIVLPSTMLLTFFVIILFFFFSLYSININFLIMEIVCVSEGFLCWNKHISNMHSCSTEGNLKFMWSGVNSQWLTSKAIQPIEIFFL